MREEYFTIVNIREIGWKERRGRGEKRRRRRKRGAVGRRG